MKDLLAIMYVFEKWIILKSPLKKTKISSKNSKMTGWFLPPKFGINTFVLMGFLYFLGAILI